MTKKRDPRESLTRAVRQLLETESLLGGDFLPAGQNPLPDVQPPDEAPTAGAEMSAADKARTLAEMDSNEVKGCTRCALCDSRRQTVFGEGDANAQLVFVGEGPGHEEDKSGRPFVGRAGELLVKMISAMGLTRQQVYICSVIKCRPPENRNPMPYEIQACLPYLIRQLQIIAPKVIVTMGNPATQTLLETKTGISRMRGTWRQLPVFASGLADIAVMPTFHPAYLLRNYSHDTRSKVWGDLQLVMEALELKPPEKK